MSDQPKDHGMAVWTVVLRELLCWERDRVAAWASKWLPFMDDPLDRFYHETDLYYVTELLIPETIQGHPEIAIGPLCEELEDAILGDSGVPILEPTFDWAAARKRVDSVLQAHGETLASIKQQLDAKGK